MTRALVAATIAAALAACSSARPRAAPPTTAVAPPVTAVPAPATSVPRLTTPVPPPTARAPVAPVPVATLPAVADDAGAVTAALAATEASILDPATPLSAVPSLGATEQRLLAALAGHADWLPSVLAALPAAGRDDVADAVQGDMDLSAVPGPTPTAVPPWSIVAPQPAGQLLDDYQQAQDATGVPWTVLAAINLVETRMGRIVGPSSAGAQGPMQFLPSTWAAYGAGGDIHDAADAIAAAARFLRANGAGQDLSGALYHYNPSTSYVRGVLAFAAAMAGGTRAYYAFYGWQVYVTTTAGTFLLPEGFTSST